MLTDIKQKINNGINWTKQKLSDGWNWIKRNAKLAIAGTAIAATFVGGEILTPQYPVLSIDGQQVEFNYTDNNTGENLIIYTSYQNYMRFGGTIDVYFAVKNNSGIDQNISIVLSLEKDNPIAISSYAGEQIIESIIPSHFEGGTTTEAIWVETATTTASKTIWAINQKEVFDNNLSETIRNKQKDIKGYNRISKSIDSIKAGETKFYKANVTTRGLPNNSEFFIEVYGDKDGYSHLDPWTYEQLFNVLNDGDLNTQDSFSGDTAFDVQTSVMYEGAKAGSVVGTGAVQAISRAITDISDGSVYIAMRITGTPAAGKWAQIYLDESGVQRMLMSFMPGGNVQIYDWTADYVTVGTFTANVWGVFNLEFDDAAQPNKYRARFHNGTSWSAFTSWISVNTGYTTINKIFIRNNSAETLYFDTITDTDPTPVASTPQFIPGEIMIFD